MPGRRPTDRPNYLMLDATHRVLADHGGAAPSEVARHLAARGYDVPRQTVRDWILKLQDQGLVDATGHSLISPLYPAYLLVDLPEPQRRPELDARMRAHDAAIARMSEAGNRQAPDYEQLPLFLVRDGSQVNELLGRPNLLVRTRVTVDGLKEIERTYRQLGVRVEAAVLVVTEAA